MLSIDKQYKTVEILKLCEVPQRFTDLKKIGITDMGLAKDLRELQDRALLIKTEDGRYVLTEEGGVALKELKELQVLNSKYWRVSLYPRVK